MKNKKIIIDDINVSECKCYNPNIKMDCSLYPLQPDACKNNPNCSYKNWKRKEQECDQHKKELEHAKGLLTVANKLNQALLNEREKLKKENEHLSEKEEEVRHYLEETEKFKNCISEIKSLCYEQDLNEDFFACEILQKINEVEDEKNM